MVLNNPFRFMFHCLNKALRHPLTLIEYYYCSYCDIRFNGEECPECHEKV